MGNDDGSPSISVTKHPESLFSLLIHHENIPIYFDPLKPHFYKVKNGVYRVIHYCISAQKHRLWVLVRTASNEYLAEGVLTSTHTLCFEQKYEKY